METGVGLLQLVTYDSIAPGMEVTWGDGSPRATVLSISRSGVEVELQFNLINESGKRFLIGSHHVLPKASLRVVN